MNTNQVMRILTEANHNISQKMRSAMVLSSELKGYDITNVIIDLIRDQSNVIQLALISNAATREDAEDLNVLAEALTNLGRHTKDIAERVNASLEDKKQTKGKNNENR